MPAVPSPPPINLSARISGMPVTIMTAIPRASDNFDEAKVKSQIDTISQAQSQRMLERARAENKMYNLLTPEQKKQFNENYQKRAEKMEKMRDHKPGQPKPAAAE